MCRLIFKEIGTICSDSVICSDFIAGHCAGTLWGEVLCAQSWHCTTSSILVMQESPRVGVRWSVISLNGLSYKDAGEYRCQARNMAGISEAPIKLKVVGVTRISRLPKKKKSKKTSPKSSSKDSKPKQTLAATPTLSIKDSQILQNNTPTVFPIDKYTKRSKMNQTDQDTSRLTWVVRNDDVRNTVNLVSVSDFNKEKWLF